MHLRRALLLMALVLGVVAVVETLVPVPRERASEDQGAGASATPQPAPVRTLRLRYPAKKRSRTLRVAAGAHVVLEVETRLPGQAAIPGLGLVQAIDPGTPARFDVLATRSGTFDVRFDPAAAPPARVGRLVVRPR